MADTLPPVGVRAVVENYNPFKAQMKDVNALIQDSGKTSQTAGKAAAGSGTDWTQLAGKLFVAKQAIDAVVGAFNSALELGLRGSAVEGVTDAFNNITASAGILANKLLGDLRTAARGTISDFDLMRVTNIALAGATGEFGRQFGENLPKLLEIARVQARATGQDVDFLYQSLVTGIKRASPMLIDNTGLTLKAGEATKAYAESIGKTVEQLTNEEKQIAILNATVDAGNAAIAAAGAQQQSVGEQFAAAQATMQNTIDTIGVALQPLFSGILSVINSILGAIGGLVTAIAPYVNAIAGIIGEVLKGVAGLISSFVGQLNTGDIVREFFRGAATLIGMFAQGLLFSTNKFVLPTVIGIANLIADFLLSFSPPKKGPLKRITQGAAGLMQTYAEGLLGGMDSIDEVAGQVDAALGEIGKKSRPAIEARLSQMDRALRPFQERVKLVTDELDALKEPADAALRAIDRQAQAAIDALNAGDAGAAERIRQLDAQREAIEGVVDAQQQLADEAQIQLGLMKAGQAQERSMLEVALARLPVQKQITKAAQSAQSAQSAGGAAPKPPAGAGTPTIPGAPAPSAAFSGGQPDAVKWFDKGNPAHPDFGGGGGDPLSVLKQGFAAGGGQAALDEFTGGIGKAGAAFTRVGQGIGNVSTKLAPVGKAFTDLAKTIEDALKPALDWLTNPSHEGGFINSFNKFGDMLKPFLDPIKGILESSVLEPIKSIASDVFHKLADPLTDGSFARGVQYISTNLPVWLKNFETDLDTNIVQPVSKVVNDAAKWLGDVNFPGGFAYTVKNLPTNIQTWLMGLPMWFQSSLIDPVSEAVKSVVAWFTNGDQNGTLAYALKHLPENVGLWFDGVMAKIQLNLVLPVQTKVGEIVGWFTNTGQEGGLANALAQLGNNIGGWLSDVGTKFQTGLIDPIKDKIGDVIQWFTDKDTDGTLAFAIAGLGKNIEDGLVELPQTLLDFLSTPFTDTITDIVNWLTNPDTEGGLVNTFKALPQTIKDTIGDLKTWFDTEIFGPVRAWVTGEEGGGLPGIITSIVDSFATLPTKIGDVLKAIGGKVFDSLIPPIVQVFNSMIEIINKMLNDIEGVGWAVLSAITRQPMPAKHNFIGLLSAPANPFATAAATGGMFGPGLLRVGEMGEEFIAGAQRTAVFPNSFVQAMDRMSNVMAQPAPMPIMSSSTADSHDMTNNFYGVDGGQDVMRRLSTLRARR